MVFKSLFKKNKERTNESLPYIWGIFIDIHYSQSKDYITIVVLSLVCKEIRSKVLPFLENNFIYEIRNKGKLPHFSKRITIDIDTLSKAPKSISQINFHAYRNPFVLPRYISSKKLPNLTRLSFPLQTDLHPGILPSSITHLCFLIFYSFPLTKSNLPPHLTHLFMIWNYNSLPMDDILADFESTFFDKVAEVIHPYLCPLDDLPDSLLVLFISTKVNQCQLDHLPRHLTHLGLLYYEDVREACLDNLPESLTHLYVGKRVFSPIDHLPHSLTHLSIYKHLGISCLDHLPALTRLKISASSSPIDHLPPSLRSLKLMHSFNSPVDHLPSLLKVLEINSSGFNEHVDNLPSGLMHLSLQQTKFDKPLDNLPDSLTHLTLTYFDDWYRNSLDHLPPSLQYLRLPKCSESLDYLPRGLLELNVVYSNGLDHLPSTLKRFSCHSMMHSPLDHLPSSITSITFPYSYSFPLDNLPSSLTHLYSVSTTFIEFLPPSVILLSFASNFKYSVPFFPPSIKQLAFGHEFNQPIVSLPPNLTHLTMGTFFNHPLPPLRHLAYLTVSNWYNHKLPDYPSLIFLSGTVKLNPHPKSAVVKHKRNRTGFYYYSQKS